MSLEGFKSFVKEKPGLATFVKNNEMTWQKFYEMYELYGPTNSVWNKYLGITTNGVTLKDMFSMFKNVDATELQKGINSMQKGISYIQDIIKSKSTELPTNLRESNYTPRPIYKHLDD